MNRLMHIVSQRGKGRAEKELAPQSGGAAAALITSPDWHAVASCIMLGWATRWRRCWHPHLLEVALNLQQHLRVDDAAQHADGVGAVQVVGAVHVLHQRAAGRGREARMSLRAGVTIEAGTGADLCAALPSPALPAAPHAAAPPGDDDDLVGGGDDLLDDEVHHAPQVHVLVLEQLGHREEDVAGLALRAAHREGHSRAVCRAGGATQSKEDVVLQPCASGARMEPHTLLPEAR